MQNSDTALGQCPHSEFRILNFGDLRLGPTSFRQLNRLRREAHAGSLDTVPIGVTTAPNHLASLFFSHFPPRTASVRDGEAVNLSGLLEDSRVHTNSIYIPQRRLISVNFV
jgi:hypothetical protein